MHLVAAAELARDGVEAEPDRLAEEVAELFYRIWRRLRRDYLGGFDRRLRMDGAVAPVLVRDDGRPGVATRATTAAFGAA